MLEQLKIENFRCFKSFELNHLGRVNLLVGENNCGKTSVLEAIQLFYSSKIFPVLRQIAISRGENFQDAQTNISHFFTGHNISNIPQQLLISGINNKQREYVKFLIGNHKSFSILGLIVDADNSCGSRWQSIRDACINFIPDLPKDIPVQGLVQNSVKKNGKSVRFGVWIMPDNKAEGMLETFLSYLVKDESEFLWQYSQEVVFEAKAKGANYKPTHVDKANIHTWLAWQDEPGNQLHIAVKQKILDPRHPKAQNFVDWFKTLYLL